MALEDMSPFILWKMGRHEFSCRVLWSLLDGSQWVRVRGRVRVRVRTNFERRSGDRIRIDGDCDFEKVPPEQLCPSAKRD